MDEVRLSRTYSPLTVVTTSTACGSPDEVVPTEIDSAEAGQPRCKSSLRFISAKSSQSPRPLVGSVQTSSRPYCSMSDTSTMVLFTWLLICRSSDIRSGVRVTGVAGLAETGTE